jgi:hypothetical protein
MEANMDFVLDLGLAICIVGQLYYFHLSTTYGDREDPSSANAPQVQPTVRHDPLSGHVQAAARTSLHDRLRAL